MMLTTLVPHPGTVQDDDEADENDDAEIVNNADGYDDDEDEADEDDDAVENPDRHDDDEANKNSDQVFGDTDTHDLARGNETDQPVAPEVHEDQGVQHGVRDNNHNETTLNPTHAYNLRYCATVTDRFKAAFDEPHNSQSYFSPSH
jgi:hypothetical protein